MQLCLIFTIVSSFFVFKCLGNSDHEQALVNMVHNICKLARDKLKIQDLDPQDKIRTLNHVKHKMMKAAQSLGVGEAQEIVQLIVQGISILSNEENYKQLCNENTSADVKRRVLFNMKTEPTDVQETVNEPDVSSGDENKTKKVKNIVQRLEVILREAIDKESTLEAKQEKITNLKEQILETFQLEFKKKEANDSAVDLYSEIIAQGIDATFQSLLQSNPSQGTKVPQNRRKLTNEDDLKEENMKSNITDAAGRFNCVKVIKNVCSALRKIDTFVCHFDDTTLTIQQVCDGTMDCPDGSDEKNCIRNVTEKVQQATKLISTVELTRFCFKELNRQTENSVVSTQGKLLTSILESEVRFLEKYSNMSSSQRSQLSNDLQESENDPKYYNSKVYQIVSEIAAVIRTFSVSLSEALCFPAENEKTPPAENVTETPEKNIKRNFHSDIDTNDIACDCRDEKCISASCTPQCNKLCQKIYDLDRFICQSVIKHEESVSIDVVCDGKLDCFDESDELGCDGRSSLSKFEGNKLYDEVLRMLHIKSLVREYEGVLPKMVQLSKLIKALQSRIVQPITNNKAFKIARDDVFRMLKSIFVEMAQSMLPYYEKHADQAYDFFISVNKKLMAALKVSHTGNEQVISSSECVCRGLECVDIHCGDHCKKVCQIKALLTSFACNNNETENDVIVPIENICDGKIQCPNARDELDCKNEVCGGHHMKIIWNAIAAIAKKYEETSLGPLLEEWKEKIHNRFLITETSKLKISASVFKARMRKILGDLSVTYASMERYRRVAKNQMKPKFLKVSQHLLELMKICNN